MGGGGASSASLALDERQPMTATVMTVGAAWLTETGKAKELADKQGVR